MNLNGWDLVYGASTTVINRLLAQNTGQLLSTFDYKRSETEDGFSCQVKINGNFSPWYVVKGGSNKLINVVLPIQSGTMKVTGQAASSLLGNTSYKAGDTILLDGIAVTMQMSISFKVSSQEPNVRELKFDFTDQDNAQSHSPAIVAKDITDPKNYLTNEWLKTCLKKALVDCLLANKSDIPFVFASVLNIAQP